MRNRYNGKVVYGECYEFTLDDVEMTIQLLRYKAALLVDPAKMRQSVQKGILRAAEKIILSQQV